MTTVPKKTDTSPELQEGQNGHLPHPFAFPVNWSQMGKSEHFVQFYESDEYLLDSLTGFIGTGLSLGDACIVVATKSHRDGLEERLKADGFDLAAAHSRGEYIPLDALETLSKFMVDGLPDSKRFSQVIESLIVQAAHGQRQVRIFGEMVALLWIEGNQAGAMALEELWNSLHNNSHPFSLFCAYSIYSFAGESYREPFIQICQQHSQVIPDGSYTRLASSDERLRAITLLQQKATSLQTEITERKGAEEAMRASEERFRTVFALAPVGMSLTDIQGRFVQVNPVYSQITGYTEQELLQTDFPSITHPEDLQENMRLLQEMLAGNIPSFLIEKRYLKKDGSAVWVQCNVSPVRNSKGELVNIFVITEDISERKKAEERKDTFISMASHELKTPVTSLKGFTQVLKRRLKQQADPQTLLFLDRMDVQLNKLTKLITDLLDISKIQTGTLAFRETNFDLDELMRETVENVQATTTTHHLDLQGETHAQVNADRDRLGQVLTNLLTNAIKYSPKADTVIVSLSKDHEQVEVAVQDFGIGIDKQYHEHIFERFYQVTDLQEQTYPGLGIGLYIARTLIERHGGRLWIAESQKGAGSTFRFSLPLPGKDQDTCPLQLQEEIF